MTKLVGHLAAALIAIALSASAALAQNFFPTPGGSNVNGAVQMCLNASSQAVPCAGAPITASSGNQANANAVATLATAVGKTTYICGFTMTSAGSTAATVVSPTITGVIGGTQTFTYVSVAGVTLGNTPLVVDFAPCLPASSLNTAIVVTLPALGAGNTNATATAWGFQF